MQVESHQLNVQALREKLRACYRRELCYAKQTSRFEQRGTANGSE